MIINPSTVINNKPQIDIKSQKNEAPDVFSPSAKDDLKEEKHKLILLQVDGLSKPSLERAMSKGYTPHLKELMDKGSHILRSYNCGISPITYAIVSSILYGVELPGNEWYDKQKGELLTATGTENLIQEEAKKRGETSLLEDGVTYSSPLSGGAKETAGVVSDFKKSVKEDGFIKTLLKEAKHDLPLLKKGGYSLTKLGWMCMKGFFRVAKDLIKNGRFNNENKLAPGLVSINETIMPRIATEGVKKAIDEHKPVVYVDYVGHDCAAHYCGNDSKEAMNFLKEVDGMIGEITEKVKNSDEKYDVIIFSDHGHTSVKPFSKIYGKPVEETIKEMAQSCSVGYKDGDIEFANSDSMGNIYFTKEKNSVTDIKTIEKALPGFGEKLINHPGIGLVITRDDDNYILKGKEGSLTINHEGAVVEQKGKNPLSHFGEDGLIRRHLANYMEVPHTGDIVIFGDYDGEKVVGFGGVLASTHGGIGGEQSQPFILTSPDLPLASKEIYEATDFHKILLDIKNGKKSYEV